MLQHAAVGQDTPLSYFFNGRAWDSLSLEELRSSLEDFQVKSEKAKARLTPLIK
jgi:hypothetical protein